MIYDENPEGQIVDTRYAKDRPVTRYKLVCEIDIDKSSLPKSDQHLLKDFIECGLKSTARGAVVKEVKDRLCDFRLEAEKRGPKNNEEVLLDRIDRLSGSRGRPEEVVILEHLVGTSGKDPVFRLE